MRRARSLRRGRLRGSRARGAQDARAEMVSSDELRRALLVAVDALGHEEWLSLFETGGGRMNFVAFARAMELSRGFARLQQQRPRAIRDRSGGSSGGSGEGDDEAEAGGGAPRADLQDGGAEQTVQMFALLDPSGSGVVGSARFWAYVGSLQEDARQQQRRGLGGHGADDLFIDGSRDRARASPGEPREVGEGETAPRPPSKASPEAVRLDAGEVRVLLDCLGIALSSSELRDVFALLQQRQPPAFASEEAPQPPLPLAAAVAAAADGDGDGDGEQDGGQRNGTAQAQHTVSLLAFEDWVSSRHPGARARLAQHLGWLQKVSPF
jgi:hypothetical protein